MAQIPEVQQYQPIPHNDERPRPEYQQAPERGYGRPRNPDEERERERQRRRGAAYAPRDTASVHGIPPGEMTEAVQHAIADLAERIDVLREELEREERRVAHLEEQADHHSLYPTLNRRAFMRELGRMITYSGRAQVGVSVALFSFDDLWDMRRRAGRFAAEAYKDAAARHIRDTLRETDILGAIGDDGFAAILAPCDAEEARQRMAQLADELDAMEVNHEGRPVESRVRLGLHTVDPENDTAISAVGAADRDLWRD